MEQLLIDGVDYDLWTPPREDDLEASVEEHAEDIFGNRSLYFNVKKRLKSQAGVVSIPDGYVIALGENPAWHIVEVELSTHDLYQHIVSQVSKFINGIKSPQAQKVVATAIYEEIDKDDFLKLRVKKAIESAEIHKFLSDLVAKKPILTVIIEEVTEELKEVLSSLPNQQVQVVEFQTFVRRDVGVGAHAHLFEPVHAPTSVIPVTSTAANADPSTGDVRYRTFWRQLLGQSKERTSLFTRVSPQGYNFISMTAGKPGLSFNYWVRRHDCGVELYIDRGKNREVENKEIFDRLLSHKQEIEAAFEDSLSWERLDQKRASRIGKTIKTGGIWDQDKWQDSQTAMIDSMIRLDKSLRPHI